MNKKGIQAWLQRILGFELYLAVFSVFKILTLRWDGPDREGDFNQFLKLLRKGDFVLDIGANIGIMTVLMARMCKPGMVHAFEPILENEHTLKRVVRFLGIKNVTVHGIALGNELGTVEMSMPVMEGVRMQGLSHVVHETISGYETDQLGYKVPLVPLDELEQLTDIPVVAIKMDVENYEQFVLEGGMHFLRKNLPLIFCELWDNENRTRCMELLGDLGYQARVWRKGILVDYDPVSDPNHNFLFVPPAPFSGGPERWTELWTTR